MERERNCNQSKFYIFRTTFESSSITEGAVIPLPSRSNADLVARRIRQAAKGGPYDKSHKLQAAVAPAKISPKPPHLLQPPSVPTKKDLSLSIIMSIFPLIKSLKGGFSLFPGSYIISSLGFHLSKRT